MMQIRIYFVALSVSVMLLATNWLAGCSSDSPKNEAQTVPAVESTQFVIDSAAYADWETFAHEHIRFHYPIAHQQMGSFEDMATSFSLALTRASNFFGLPIPDTVDVYFYTGPGQSEEITGSIYPFVKDGVVHFTLPSYFGPPMAQLMLQKWEPAPPKYRFLREGIISLLDYSNQNYYQFTQDFVDRDSLIPLAQLAQDTVVNSNIERYQSALAATFVDYYALRYSRNALRALYKTNLPFDEAVRQTTGLTVEQLQHDWLRFIEGALLSMYEKDNSIIDSIVNQRGR